MLKQLNGDITSAVCLILLREEQQRHKLGKQLLSRLLANGGSFALGAAAGTQENFSHERPVH